LALVIPTLREAANLPGLLTDVRSALDPLGIDYEIIVVDDDSRDGTEEIVSAISLEDPRVRLLVRKGERGLSGAVLYGWQHTDAAILGVMDADLQHPPELLAALVSAILAGNDMAIGSRYMAHTESRHPRQRPHDGILSPSPRVHRRN
jgi:dolichol-phosphate mannosyltransferase